MADFQINNYRYRETGGKFIVTSDSGNWLFLSKEELASLKKEDFSENDELFQKLKNKGIILMESNVLREINDIRNRSASCFQGVSLHIVIPTLKCNHRCVYCHAGVSSSCSEDMTEDTAKKIVDFIFQSPSKQITIEFQGGEPLLRFDLIKFIINYAKQKNLSGGKDLLFTVVSNLSLIDDEKLKFLADNDISICTSLDGPKEIHDFNRKFLGGKSSYDLVSSGINKVNEYYTFNNINSHRLNALITITKKSLNYSKEIIDEYQKQGFDNLHLRFLNNLGDARSTFNDIGYSPEEFIDFWKRSMDYILELNLSGKVVVERGALIILKKLLTKHDPNFLEMRSPCGACISQLAYSPDGKIFSCDEARMLGEDLFKIGDVSIDSYRGVLGCNKTCSIITSSMNDNFICDSCAYKPFCGVCPVCNYAEQGSLIAKIPQTSRCKIYMAQFDYLIEKLKDEKIKAIFEEWVVYQ